MCRPASLLISLLKLLTRLICTLLSIYHPSEHMLCCRCSSCTSSGRERSLVCVTDAAHGGTYNCSAGPAGRQPQHLPCSTVRLYSHVFGVNRDATNCACLQVERAKLEKAVEEELAAEAAADEAKQHMSCHTWKTQFPSIVLLLLSVPPLPPPTPSNTQMSANHVFTHRLSARSWRRRWKRS